MPIVSIVSAAAVGSLGAGAALALSADASVVVAVWLGAGSLGTLPAVRRGLRGQPAQTR
ncbi:hypothetical protein [Gemmobacter sp.]|uniref:hypothetical protein n=1 Tax=Gemmobacter sp. TaxID=1898957 RepID=UPI002AFF3AEB|nr:hypothetical protein [Gemmobacter sp.]